MRRRLVAYFDRKNCIAPDDLADETMSRVAHNYKNDKKKLATFHLYFYAINKDGMHGAASPQSCESGAGRAAPWP